MVALRGREDMGSVVLDPPPPPAAAGRQGSPRDIPHTRNWDTFTSAKH